VTNAGGQLVLANAGERIHDILKVTKLYMIFDSFGTIDDAIQSLLDGRNGGSARLAGMRTIIPA
jgi:hypothetical protein